MELSSTKILKSFFIPIVETGCLSNLYYLLAAQASSVLIYHLSRAQSVRTLLVPYHLQCSACLTYRMPCHAIGHQVLPT